MTITTGEYLEIQKAKKWIDKSGFDTWIVASDGYALGMPLIAGTLMVEYKDNGESCVCTIRNADDFGAFKYEVEEMERFTP